MKKILLYALLLVISHAVLGQTTVSLPPDGDYISFWKTVPNSGSEYTKVDDPPTIFADGDYVYKDETVIGNQEFTMKDPPGGLVKGDVAIIVRAALLSGVSNLTITVNKNGFTVTSLTFTPSSGWENYTVFVDNAKRSDIVNYQVNLQAGSCLFFPSCTVAVSSVSMDISNAKFTMDTP